MYIRVFIMCVYLFVHSGYVYNLRSMSHSFLIVNYIMGVSFHPKYRDSKGVRKMDVWLT